MEKAVWQRFRAKPHTDFSKKPDLGVIASAEN